MPDEPIIFSPELHAQAHAAPEGTRSLLHRWAVFRGHHWQAVRSQLEAAARLVPLGQRRRVLGPLFSDDDMQVQAAAGVILLAKLLADHGWTVEHEPEIDGVTPDLKITKNAAEFVVEARHVRGDFGLPSGYQRLQAALRGITTRTPAHFSVIEVDGGAGLKPFRAFLLRALRDQKTGPLEFHDKGVRICFELHHPPLDSEIGVFLTCSPEPLWFDDRAAVRTALDEKLKKYPFPLILALQGVDTGDLFMAAEQELLGGEVIEIPISHVTGGPAGPERIARARDSALLRGGSDGARVRDRLQALLPFEPFVSGRGFQIRARLLANPAKPDAVGLEQFRPLPSLMHTGPGQMGYLDGDGNLTLPDELRDCFLL